MNSNRKSTTIAGLLYIFGMASGILRIKALAYAGIAIITPTYILLALPTAIQEMVMAVWLVVKGFNPSASETAKAW